MCEILLRGIHSLIRRNAGWLLVSAGCVTAAPAAAPQLVPKWEKFEAIFQATGAYINPVQDVSLEVRFVSPSGQTNVVSGFWDGGRTWRIRFAPDELGSWWYQTRSSNSRDRGLHLQKGYFQVTPPRGQSSRFRAHGPLRVAPTGRSLQHDDRTPFFWMADTAWNGPLLSTVDEWDFYLTTRSRQKFSAIQWVATPWRGAPRGDLFGERAFEGVERIVINPEFFRRLDVKVAATAQAGLLNVPVLLWAVQSDGDRPELNPGFGLPEDQAILLARYMVARWSAFPAVWVLGGDGDYNGEHAEKWRRIGRAVFGDQPKALVAMHPRTQEWIIPEFKDEPWMKIIGYQSGQDDSPEALRWLTRGPITEKPDGTQPRPIINLETAYEHALMFDARSVIPADHVRRALYWSLLQSPTAGVTYGAHGVWGWDRGGLTPPGHPSRGIAPNWRRTLGSPGALSIQHLVDLFGSIDFWRLLPAPELVVNQPGTAGPQRFVAAASTLERDTTLVYAPDNERIELNIDSLARPLDVRWFNPRTGERGAPIPVDTQDGPEFRTPGPGDWVLILTRHGAPRLK